MLSEDAYNKITSLALDPEAKMVCCVLPLGSIFWTDELPDHRLIFTSFAPGNDQEFVAKVFALRMRLWTDGRISEGDLEFWENARILFPNWPLFKRLELGKPEREALESIDREIDDFIELFSQGSTEFSVMQSGSDTNSNVDNPDEPQKKVPRWRFWGK